MHFNHQLPLMIVWWGCSLTNWFMMMGYYNKQFKEELKYEDNIFWIVSASLFSGIAGFIVSAWSFKFKYWAWRPYTKNEKDQMKMLRMLEGESEPMPDSGAFTSSMAMPLILPKRKASTKKGTAKKVMPLKARTK